MSGTMCSFRWPSLVNWVLRCLSLQLMYQCHARDMCSIVDQRSAIVGNRLFFSSGNYTFDDGQPLRSTSSLYWISLNDTFDMSSPIDMSMIGSVDLPSESLTGDVPPASGGSAGTPNYDHTTLYPYAGLVGPESDGINNALWSFDSTSDSWKPVTVEGGRISLGVRRMWPRAPPSTPTVVYGVRRQRQRHHQAPVEQHGLPAVDLRDRRAGHPGARHPQGGDGYVCKDQAEVLLAFGGYQTAYRGTEFLDRDWDQRSFSDVFSNTWYRQTATGDLPDLHTEFCAGVSPPSPATRASRSPSTAGGTSSTAGPSATSTC
ncbi:hypothetical protein GGR56DRAFT_437980 [Xylariaceae sp. FL0804]|nr:hypothetical protein GGR56DRAFT_437980 [Xylariaceae sp. FL0804]